MSPPPAGAFAAQKMGKFARSMLSPLWPAIVGSLVTLGGAIAIARLTDLFFPPTKSVDLGQICLQSGLTGGAYFSDINGVPLNAPGSRVIFRKDSGLVVGVALTAHGFDSSTLKVDGIMFDALHGDWDPSRSEVVTGIGYYRNVPIDADTVLRDPQFWVPLPKKAGTYVVRVDVWDSRDQFRLASKEGPKFVVRKNGVLKFRTLHQFLARGAVSMKGRQAEYRPD